ncbi:ATP-grasp domain-containing protein [Solemya pervernicosa gill symbiont]|nr:ATP-grasp domain-containing protein [Solemya pervernicosa gill symbiont]
MTVASRQRARLLLVAPHNSYRIAPYIEAANRLDIDFLVASEGKHSLVGAVADGLHIDLSDPQQALERLLEAAAEHPFAGVVGSDDATIEMASRLAAQLNLPHNPPQAAVISRRKDLARATLADAGVPVPKHWLLDLRDLHEKQLASIEFPSVVKPLAMSGSRGVIRVDDQAQLSAAVERVRPMLRDGRGEDEQNMLLVEAYLPGREVALEGMLHRGELSVLALFDKPDPLEGPFFEESYYITPSRFDEATQQSVAEVVVAACHAYGLQEGPVHAELRINDAGPWVLEVASRTIGGQCGRLLRFGTGRSLEELVLSQAMGEPLTLQADRGGAGVLMIPIPEAGLLRRVEGLMAANKVEWIEDIEISVREGYELVPLPEGESYLGFIFARAPSPEQAEAALREAHAHLKIVVAPLMKIGFA